MVKEKEFSFLNIVYLTVFLECRHMGFARKAFNLFDHIVTILIIIACILLAVMTLSIGFNVIFRYFKWFSFPWVVEVTPWMLLYVVFLGASWVLKEDGHVKLEIVSDLLKPKTNAAMSFGTSIVGAFVCLILCWYGAEVTLENLQKGTFNPAAIRFPNFAILMAIPIGSFFLFIEFLRRSYKFFKVWRENNH
jgi:TRAP-type C4-dicarboxylate transport system permease small subunit